ncbi:ArsR/SmtB family transcription factor [Sciscionella marina]|uniref:ArsR/SmtB family transcription factor n=1 Tax=Sciscionella marina TaxID=508770 RepID=UPI000365EC2A|nr:metalloregulator ArsR/SmtB family transcription factor [Sciscionella marina]
MDEVFRALADANRRSLLDRLNAHNGQSLRELCAGLDMARQSVSKHLAVLEAAGLIATTWRGREKLHYLNAEPINAIAERWMNQYERERANALADLKTVLESKPMADNEFLYVTYIRTTSEQLWTALTDPAFTTRYWGVALKSTWETGAPLSYEQFGVLIEDPEQVIVESDPYRVLSYTWHTITDEFGEAAGIDREWLAKAKQEKRSTVRFELEPQGETVKLTVRHYGFEPGSAVLAGITGGWPAILAGLKTLLETGETLPEG